MLHSQVHTSCFQAGRHGQQRQGQRLAAAPTVGSRLCCALPNMDSSQHCRYKGHVSPNNVSRNGALVARAVSPRQDIDVVGFGNLCVDAVLALEELPPADPRVRRPLLDTLTASPPDKSLWEVGGNCNFMVAAARLGLRVASVGHIGSDVYGEFMDEVLRGEGVQATTRIAPMHLEQPAPHDSSTSTSTSGCCANGGASHGAAASTPDAVASATGGGGSNDAHLNSTLICFVLVDPASRHAFCSRYDFGPWPLLQGIRTLPGEATQVLRASRAVFTNGFIFDELPLEAVQAACSDAIRHGAAIFFDPGPRCQTMLEGPRRAALDLLLDLSAVVLMTEEEARVVTGLDDPEAAAQWVLARPGARAQWVVVKMGAQGALLCARSGSRGATSTGNGNGNGHGHGNGNGSSHGKNADGGCGCSTSGDSGAAAAAVASTTTRMGSVKVEVVDTVGCGDSFAAAVVMGFTRGWPADATLALANAVGGATATGRGAGRNVARLEKVLALLAEGAAGAAGGGELEQRAAFSRAQELLREVLAHRQARDQGQSRQLSAAA